MKAKNWLEASFGDWVVIGTTSNPRKVLVRCKCGVEREVAKCSLSTGGSKSCGGHPQRKSKPRWRSKLKQNEKGCMEYTGFRNAGGYGLAGCGLVHRQAYREAFGEIPEGMMVLHKCDNPACANPEHLFLGNNASNMADMKNKGRGRARPGEHSPNAKLTMVEAREIRHAYCEGCSQMELASKYGVSQRAISLIVRNETYVERPKLPKTIGGYPDHG